MNYKNIGPIKQGDLQLGNLTVLCGGNNQGKTYITYALYGVLGEMVTKFHPLNDSELDLFSEGLTVKISKETFNDRYATAVVGIIKKSSRKILNDVFNITSNDKAFIDSEIIIEKEEVINFLGLSSTHMYFQQLEFEKDIYSFEVKENEIIFSCIRKKEKVINLEELNKDDNIGISNVLFSLLVEDYISKRMNIFYIPAERTGINVFAKELYNDRAKMMENLNRHLNNKDILNALKQRRSPYPKPVDEYLNYVNNLNDYDLKVDVNNDISEIIRNEMVGGRFGFDINNGTTYFKMKNEEKISLHMASSSAKSLFGLDYYIDNINNYDINNYLIIDEPEINLHPSNQISFAVVIDELIKAGVNVIISTHSDFLMKKLLNIVLDNKLNKNKGVSSENTKIYEVTNGSINEIDFFGDDGGFENFDKHFDKLNEEYLNLLDEVDENGD